MLSAWHGYFKDYGTFTFKDSIGYYLIIGKAGTHEVYKIVLK